jgi:hypothetical protein
MTDDFSAVVRASAERAAATPRVLGAPAADDAGARRWLVAWFVALVQRCARWRVAQLEEDDAAADPPPVDLLAWLVARERRADGGDDGGASAASDAAEGRYTATARYDYAMCAGWRADARMLARVYLTLDASGGAPPAVRWGALMFDTLGVPIERVGRTGRARRYPPGTLMAQASSGADVLTGHGAAAACLYEVWMLVVYMPRRHAAAYRERLNALIAAAPPLSGEPLATAHDGMSVGTVAARAALLADDAVPQLALLKGVPDAEVGAADVHAALDMTLAAVPEARTPAALRDTPLRELAQRIDAHGDVAAFLAAAGFARSAYSYVERAAAGARDDGRLLRGAALAAATIENNADSDDVAAALRRLVAAVRDEALAIADGKGGDRHRLHMLARTMADRARAATPGSGSPFRARAERTAAVSPYRPRGGATQ